MSEGEHLTPEEVQDSQPKESGIEEREEEPTNTYEPMAGENISETVERMIALAKETDGSVKVKFNDVELMATRSSIAEDIVADFHAKLQEAAEKYHKSPEGQRAARESEDRKQEAQRKADALMEQLPNLDFNDQKAVLDWICEFQGPSDHIGVVKDGEKVVKIFAEHGYQPNVNTGEAFNGEDRDNFARYIIGQALSGLQSDVGAIHQIVHKFTNDWKKK